LDSKALLDQNSLNAVKITAMDHNWDMVSSYAIPAVQAGGDAYEETVFHCYGGNLSNMVAFHNAFPSKEMYFMECTELSRVVTGGRTKSGG